MKKILLLSDTHSFIDDGILKYAKKADEIWHAGDIGNIDVYDKLEKITKTRAVYGNIDDYVIRSAIKEVNTFICEKVKVSMIHIAGKPPYYNRKSKLIIRQEKPKIFICGHSHILKVIYDKKLSLLHLNPGAAGNSGFHKVKTLLRFSIDGKEIKDMDIIEMGKRG